MLVASPVLCDKDYSAQPSPLESKDKHFIVLLFANSPRLSVASSLPRLRFSSHRGEFAATTFCKDDVLPRANGSIVSSGTVVLHDLSQFKVFFVNRRFKFDLLSDQVVDPTQYLLS